MANDKSPDIKSAAHLVSFTYQWIIDNYHNQYLIFNIHSATWLSICTYLISNAVLLDYLILDTKYSMILNEYWMSYNSYLIDIKQVLT